MKRFVSILLVLMLCLAALPMTALAASGKTMFIPVNGSDGGQVYLRKGPGLDYAEVKVIKAGKTAKYLGTTKKDSRGVAWYKVSFNNKTGWVSSKYGKLIK